MVKKGTTGIYAIINMIDWKQYIGQSVDIKERNKNELSDLKHNRFKNHHLQHAFNKYGEENFIFIYLEECSEEKLNEREEYHVSAAGYPNHDLCYNLRAGGKSGGRRHPKSNEKQSKTRKKMFASGELEVWNKDKKCPQISESKKGEKCYWYGKKNPGQSERMTKNWEDPEYILKQKEAHKGQEAWNKDKKCPEISEKMTGEKNHQAKLTERQVRSIKLLLRNLTHRGAIQEIAAIYGVTPGNIKAIKYGKSWKDVGIEADGL
jgi:group I intron endonuclease